MAKEKRTGRISTRVLALVLVLMLVFGGVFGGTIAWLIATPDPVVNTFTYGDIDITLEETEGDVPDGDNDPNTNKYKMMPGQEIPKDPTVTVKADSENCWLFVKLEKTSNFDEFMTYAVADGWVQLKDDAGSEIEGVYYRYQETPAADTAIEVLRESTVTVKDTVTKAMLNALDENADGTPASTQNYPKLTVTAYAVQYVGFEAEISDGAASATAEQVNAAALKAWNAAQA